MGEAYVERLPNARLLTEEEGKSPLAWQGARLSKEIAGFLRENDWHGPAAVLT